MSDSNTQNPDTQTPISTPIETDAETEIGVMTPPEAASEQAPVGGSHARAGQAAYIRHSARMRKILLAVIIILILLVVAIGFVVFRLFDTASTAATQQTQVSDVSTISEDEVSKDASSITTKRTTVPDLTALLGMTQDEAIATLQRGAQITSALEQNEEGNPVRWEIKISLTSEPSDGKSGTPMVYLSLNEEGRAIRCGYSAATSVLGYGSLSFSDAVKNEAIIEKTLAEAGLEVPVGSVELPADKMAYSSYGSDGTTLVREYCSFEGVGTANGVEHPWSAVLSYDYSAANATGNLADTVRIVYVYIDA